MRFNQLVTFFLCIVIALGPSCSLIESFGDAGDARAEAESKEIGVAVQEGEIATIDRQQHEKELELLQASSDEEREALEYELAMLHQRKDEANERLVQMREDLAFANGRAAAAEEIAKGKGDTIVATAGLTGGPAAGGMAQLLVGGGSALALLLGRLKAVKAAT